MYDRPEEMNLYLNRLGLLFVYTVTYDNPENIHSNYVSEEEVPEGSWTEHINDYLLRRDEAGETRDVIEMIKWIAENDPVVEFAYRNKWTRIDV